MTIMKKNIYALLICTSLVSLCNGMKSNKEDKEKNLQALHELTQTLISSQNTMINFLSKDQEARTQQGLPPDPAINGLLNMNRNMLEFTQRMDTWQKDLQKREKQKQEIINAAPQLENWLQQNQAAKAQLGENATDEQKKEILEPSIQKLQEILEPFKPASPENNEQTPEITMSQQEAQQ